MSDGKPNILGKLPVYNSSGELFDSSSDAKIMTEHKKRREGQYARSDAKGRDETKRQPSKSTKRTQPEKGTKPAMGRKGPVYSTSKTTASGKGEGSKRTQKAPPKKKGK